MFWVLEWILQNLQVFVALTRELDVTVFCLIKQTLGRWFGKIKEVCYWDVAELVVFGWIFNIFEYYRFPLVYFRLGPLFPFFHPYLGPCWEQLVLYKSKQKQHQSCVRETLFDLNKGIKLNEQSSQECMLSFCTILILCGKCLLYTRIPYAYVIIEGLLHSAKTPEYTVVHPLPLQGFSLYCHSFCLPSCRDLQCFCVYEGKK